jgi:hypothetical protein
VDEVKLAAADDGSGKPRQLLQLPMVLHGKDGKKGTAPDGGPLLVWDLAVNPNAVQHANTSRQGLDTLVNMVRRCQRGRGHAARFEIQAVRLPPSNSCALACYCNVCLMPGCFQQPCQWLHAEILYFGCVCVCVCVRAAGH